MMHCIQFAFFFIATTASLFAFVSAGVLQDNFNDIVIGGMNGPVNFSRPEGERLFYYYVPSTYTPSKPLPFIIYFHGYGGCWAQGVMFNQTDDVETNGYIIAFAQGTPSAETGHSNGWNGGKCCLFNTTIPVDDVTYAKTIVRLASDRVAIAPNRVYAMGWSNGGYMSERLGCEAWDVFNGVAPDASSVVIGNGYEDGLSKCDAAFQGGKIDYIHFHGTVDNTVPWIGGHDTRERLPSILENLSRWVTRNGCDNVQKETYNNGNFTNIVWPNCRGGTSVELMSVWNAPHIWWTVGNSGFSTADYVMKAFTKAFMQRENAKLSSTSQI
jgi:polyhydroxybutyrate depolymerase